eukprot:GHVT01072558.1.p1 GENE.GHVT01072558.1~~GHVT01072558.1.p1  ORF type:complete len:131 (-),score=17.90 GHVT01072558.1:1407-1799(-)
MRRPPPLGTSITIPWKRPTTSSTTTQTSLGLVVENTSTYVCRKAVKDDSSIRLTAKPSWQLQPHIIPFIHTPVLLPLVVSRSSSTTTTNTAAITTATMTTASPTTAANLNKVHSFRKPVRLLTPPPSLRW